MSARGSSRAHARLASAIAVACTLAASSASANEYMKTVMKRLDKAMGVQRTILPLLVFGAGLTGTTVGFILQAFTNASSISLWALVWVTGYPFLISGKPFLSLPAFIPVMFELTILLSATSCEIGRAHV